jgi:hypothetical protein
MSLLFPPIRFLFNTFRTVWNGLVLGVLVVAGIWGYQAWEASPVYSLVQAGDAMANHNWPKFTTFVDTHQLTRTAVSDYASSRENLLTRLTTKTLNQPLSVLLNRQMKLMVVKPIDPNVPIPQFSHVSSYWQSGDKAWVGLVLKQPDKNGSQCEIPVSLELQRTFSSKSLPAASASNKNNPKQPEPPKPLWRVSRITNVPQLGEALDSL